jgi:predicted transcriptional regulator
MHKTTIYLPDETVSEIKLAARSDGRSEAEIIREALDGYFARRRSGLPSVFGKAKGKLFTAAESEDWLLENWPPE